MKARKKIDRKLNGRISAYRAMVASNQHEFKVAIRLATGGYKCPGSRKK